MRTYEGLEVGEGGELVGGEFERVQALGVDGQVLQLVAADLVLGELEAAQVVVGGEVLERAQAGLVHGERLEAGELGEEVAVVGAELLDGHLVEDEVVVLGGQGAGLTSEGWTSSESSSMALIFSLRDISLNK